MTHCPNCGAQVPVHEGFVIWCEWCNWNLLGDDRVPAGPVDRPEPLDSPDPPDVDRVARDGERTVAALVAEDHLRPRRDDRRLRTLLLALAINSMSLVLLVAGIGLLAWSWFRWIPLMVLGAFMVVEAIALRPRFPRPPKRTRVWTRAELPETFACVDRVTEVLGARPIHGIVVDRSFNAGYTAVGARRRPLLRIGLPMWQALPPTARLAVLGHEIGHQVNGDVTQGLLVRAARAALEEWNQIAQPARLRIADSSTRGGATIAAVFLAPVRWTTGALDRALSRSAARSHQLAEYYADQLAATVASTEGAEQMLDTSLIGASVMGAIERAARRGDPRSMEEVERDFLAKLPSTERTRLARVATLERASVDGTHPPTADRITVIHDRPSVRGAIRHDAVDWAAIDAELARAVVDRRTS